MLVYTYAPYPGPCNTALQPMAQNNLIRIRVFTFSLSANETLFNDCNDCIARRTASSLWCARISGRQRLHREILYIIQKFRCCGRCGNQQVHFHLAALLTAIFDDHGMMQSSLPELFTEKASYRARLILRVKSSGKDDCTMPWSSKMAFKKAAR